jgi:type II secretory pathway component PulM
VTGRRWWQFWRPAPDRGGDATAELAKLAERDDEVTRLGKELRAAQHRNHFSTMVQRAIARTQEDPHP